MSRAQSAGALLLLDSGNSRLKWAVSRADQRARAPFAASGAIELAALRRSAAPLLRVLRTCDPQTRIYACNVAGVALQRRIRAAVARAGLPAPRFARSVAACGGVRNAYADPWRLGVDRWVALIGARARYPGQALCIVAVGSALTIDLLGVDGRHRGGCIVPGPRMMIDSLLNNTAGIRRRARLSGGGALTRALALATQHAPGDSPAPGRRAVGTRGVRGAQDLRGTLFAADTRTALLAGSRHACAALIERALLLARQQLGRRPRLILGGGAADTVASLLRVRYSRQDDLVLRGLAVLAQAGIA